MNSPLFPFEHRKILQTAMPLGGIGAGCICLNVHGGLQDFSIRNRPATSALPDGHQATSDCAFALLYIKGKNPVTRLLEGPLPVEKIYDQGLQAQGYRSRGYEGLPRFRRSRFRSGYPFGQVELSDPTIPVNVLITGWSPLIPLDEIASSLPCAFLSLKVNWPSSVSFLTSANNRWNLSQTCWSNRDIPANCQLATQSKDKQKTTMPARQKPQIGIPQVFPLHGKGWKVTFAILI